LAGFAAAAGAHGLAGAFGDADEHPFFTGAQGFAGRAAGAFSQGVSAAAAVVTGSTGAVLPSISASAESPERTLRWRVQ
jgi:hypothetical protein